ncbi:MAG TPA: hypothetical protein VKU02_21225 [Gemmataceae bacterium]|nr:hypothetical protein [Gemmataceae bacterium]
MRPIRLTSLVILGLLASGPWVQANGRVFKRIARPPVAFPVPMPRSAVPPKEPEILLSRTVDGWGETVADAEQMALENARRVIVDCFALREDHPLEWRPNLNYIHRYLIKKRDALEDSEEPLRGLQGVRLWIEIDRGKWDAMLQKDREVRSESRMVLLGKLLAGVVAFLGAIAGYLRLEEMTKGYYTAWLRLAAIGFVSVVGAGIWWVS